MGLELSNLWVVAEERAKAALADGAIEPFESRAVTVDDGGVQVVVHVLSRTRAKPASGDGDSLGREDPRLELGDLEPGYRVVLNRYPVVQPHLLLVSRDFVPQEAPLGPGDFAAIGACLDAMDGVVFYNAGREAGASQARRHLQLVRAPLSGAETRTPIDAALRRNALPFPHAWGPRHRSAAAAHAAYRALLARVGVEPEQPYNLVVTRDWMLIVPRTRACFEDVSVNALGFAGAMLVASDAQLSLVRAIGPMRVLRHVCS